MIIIFLKKGRWSLAYVDARYLFMPQNQDSNMYVDAYMYAFICMCIHTPYIAGGR